MQTTNTDGKIFYKELSYAINGILFQTHRALGAYANEKQYCDQIEALLKTSGLPYEREKVLPPSFLNERPGRNRLDFIIDDKIILEIKRKNVIERMDYDQALRYLHAFNKKLCILSNFQQKQVKIYRVVNSDSNGLKKNTEKTGTQNITLACSCHLHSSRIRIKIKRIDKTLPLPEYHTPGAVAFDLYAREAVTIAPGTIARIPANLVVETPKGCMLMVKDRSSTAKRTGLFVLVGYVDQDYCGDSDELQIQVYNFTKEPVTIERADRFAQAAFIRIDVAQWNEVESMGGGNRGGFGSTG